MPLILTNEGGRHAYEGPRAVKTFFERAIDNVTRHGDTDIFPFPIENHVFFDLKKETISLLQEIHKSFEESLAKFPPVHEGALVPVNYTGFRWGNQLDPLWNLYFLSLVLSIAEKIEENRIAPNSGSVCSYRYKWDDASSEMFDRTYNWRYFMEQSLKMAESAEYVVCCDISEFYPRLGHHKLENALLHLNTGTDIPSRVMKFLSHFSNTNSYGLPIGGPAARLLSEILLNQIDQLLTLHKIGFCRFADDFHIFASSMQDAMSKLLFLSEQLQRTQGLQIQKAKTRIMSKEEFITTSPINLDDTDDAPQEVDTKASTQDKARRLLRFSLKFDPYSDTPEEDYENLKKEIEKFDIMSILRAELAKSRIHIALSKKIVSALRYLDEDVRNQAVLSMLDNAELLYPIFGQILNVVKITFHDLSSEVQVKVIDALLSLLQKRSHILQVELNLAYAVRVLSCNPTPVVQQSLVEIYNRPTHAPLIRRDVILAMGRASAWHWVSERRSSFRTMSGPERRAFIVASYILRDEGKHWRDSTKDEFGPLERLVHNWAGKKASQGDWSIPL